MGPIITATTTRMELPRHPAEHHVEKTRPVRLPKDPHSWTGLFLNFGLVFAKQAVNSRSARIVMERQLVLGSGENHHHALHD